MKGKNPSSLMVFGAVTNDGRVMPPYFIPAGVMIDTDEYLTILKESLIPWMMKYHGLSKLMLVQDSAPEDPLLCPQGYMALQLARLESMRLLDVGRG